MECQIRPLDVSQLFNDNSLRSAVECFAHRKARFERSCPAAATSGCRAKKLAPGECRLRPGGATHIEQRRLLDEVLTILFKIGTNFFTSLLAEPIATSVLD